MALSVRLPPDKGPYIEHYLIQSVGGRLSLETSENRFDNIPSLIAHYSQCCDELPVQLTLPRAIREAKTRQQLSSLALLGQEFWRYPLANPRPSEPPSETSSPDSDLVLNLKPIKPLTTFKGSSPQSEVPARTHRPTPPNTLNLRQAVSPCGGPQSPQGRTPPPPPPRWSKPNSPQNNFTVTTTVTFSVNSQSARQEQSQAVNILFSLLFLHKIEKIYQYFIILRLKYHVIQNVSHQKVKQIQH